MKLIRLLLKRYLRSSGILCGIERYFFTRVSGQIVDPYFEDSTTVVVEW